MSRVVLVLICTGLLVSLVGGGIASGSRGAKVSCAQLSKRYYNALDAHNGAKAIKTRNEMVAKGCQNLPPPAIPGTMVPAT